MSNPERGMPTCKQYDALSHITRYTANHTNIAMIPSIISRGLELIFLLCTILPALAFLFEISAAFGDITTALLLPCSRSVGLKALVVTIFLRSSNSGTGTGTGLLVFVILKGIISIVECTIRCINRLRPLADARFLRCCVVGIVAVVFLVLMRFETARCLRFAVRCLLLCLMWTTICANSADADCSLRCLNCGRGCRCQPKIVMDGLGNSCCATAEPQPPQRVYLGFLVQLRPYPVPSAVGIGLAHVRWVRMRQGRCCCLPCRRQRLCSRQQWCQRDGHGRPSKQTLGRLATITAFGEPRQTLREQKLSRTLELLCRTMAKRVPRP
mmetsp:Transcript_113959/g.362387  ORF Transcript_113959/g.362387 Transcript_113959/m.362387 type:complete len:326 (+) Transcript_113959:134-1111(+)